MTTKSINLMTRQRVRDLAGKLMEEWQNVDAVAEILGCQRSAIRRWHTEYQEKGPGNDSLSKEPGRPSKLTPNQHNIIEDIIMTKTPRDMNYPLFLWSNKVIRDTIHDLFRTDLSLGTVNAMTQKMGIVRRQIFRPDQNGTNGELSDWLKNRFPFIRKLAKEQRARVFFIHDAQMTSSPCEDTNPYNRFGPNNGNGSGRKCNTRLLSAVCPRNSQRFMTFSDPLCVQPFIAFLNGLLNDIERPLFVIAEPQYKEIAREADQFLSTVADRLSLFFLPESLS